MKCPFCSFEDSKVVDSRPTDEGTSIRRRRECLHCGKRFTTYETVERMPLMLIKRDGTRQAYDRQKLLNGLVKACEKRPVSLMQLEQIVDYVEQKLFSSLESEVSSKVIGELVMEQLRKVDEVAYVRFASVYRQFKDINTFMEELNTLRQIPFCYTYGLFLRRARHSSAAHNFLRVIPPGTCVNLSIRYNFILVGAVCNLQTNELRDTGMSRLRRLSPVCVAVMYLVLRTGYKNTEEKNPLPYPFSKRSHVGNLRQTI